LELENQPTKQRILREALTLFSLKGYEPVTVAEIADAVGIKAPSLYKHFKSKRDIFGAILDEMKAGYEKQTADMQMNGVDAEKDQALFSSVSEEKLIEMTINLFLYFLHDDNVCKFRKMLTIEQYNNRELAAQYTKQYVNDPISYHHALFALLSASEVAIPENPQIMAFQYYSPVFLLLTLCDCHPEREEEAVQILEQHIRQFNRLYQYKGESKI
jgi:AcrR family transcriptional regulator